MTKRTFQPLDPNLKTLKNFPTYYIDTFAGNPYVYRSTRGSKPITLYSGDYDTLEQLLLILREQAKNEFHKRSVKRAGLQNAPESDYNDAQLPLLARCPTYTYKQRVDKCWVVQRHTTLSSGKDKVTTVVVTGSALQADNAQHQLTEKARAYFQAKEV